MSYTPRGTSSHDINASQPWFVPESVTYDGVMPEQSTPAYPEPSGPPEGGGSGTLLEERVEQLAEGGDHERFAHYVRKEKIVESAVTGEPVVALCGKVWTPGRDPSKFPVCPDCKAIYEGIPSRKGGDGGS